jgi:hypothetical protein
MQKANVTKTLLLATRYVLEKREGYYEGRGNMMVKQMNRDAIVSTRDFVSRAGHETEQLQRANNARPSSAKIAIVSSN